MLMDRARLNAINSSTEEDIPDDKNNARELSPALFDALFPG